MPLRIYICPWVGSGTKQDPFKSKAMNFPNNGTSSFFPSKVDGTPASPWIVTALRASDFTAIDADATCDDLFGGDLPASVTTRDEMIAFLRGRTVGDVPLARRNRIMSVLDKYGVVRSDFTLATPLWKVMQRVSSTLFEKDDNFAAGF